MRSGGQVNRFEPRVEVAVARTRAEVARLHKMLVRGGLVSWTSGVLSARVPDSELFVIKPGGLDHNELSPEKMVLVDLDGRVVTGTPGSELPPSRGVAVHAHLYRSSDRIGAVVHTHSPYATAFALRGEPVPCISTGVADEFGGDVPVVAYVGPDDRVGDAIARTLTASEATAVLVERHGPYTVGADARSAVRAAVLLEEAARAVQLARAGLPEGSALTALEPDEIHAIRERRLRADAERAAESAAADSYPTSRPGAARPSGGTGSRTTPIPSTVPDNDVRTTQ
ncbi:class II aldolase/adducin family protein [Homoserinibacter sp. GY 40078]|uniref:class II aldolase/adducin family protein n=1 Tax=Homoserinibacter sp. GY 40078 TaxID=2603275 RepID=UPI0011C7D470|nr:class II aldolase/adducin family protein [Homoserinibacter sp. GY 40078]TXK19418.1 L-ribulose-5-phosphate 4-epimerase [Homoserinibacter sp. GY 40078]